MLAVLVGGVRFALAPRAAEVTVDLTDWESISSAAGNQQLTDDDFDVTDQSPDDVAESLIGGSPGDMQVTFDTTGYRLSCPQPCTPPVDTYEIRVDPNDGRVRAFDVSNYNVTQSVDPVTEQTSLLLGEKASLTNSAPTSIALTAGSDVPPNLRLDPLYDSESEPRTTLLLHQTSSGCAYQSIDDQPRCDFDQTEVASDRTPVTFSWLGDAHARLGHERTDPSSSAFDVIRLEWTGINETYANRMLRKIGASPLGVAFMESEPGNYLLHSGVDDFRVINQDTGAVRSINTLDTRVVPASDKAFTTFGRSILVVVSQGSFRIDTQGPIAVNLRSLTHINTRFAGTRKDLLIRRALGRYEVGGAVHELQGLENVSLNAEELKVAQIGATFRVSGTVTRFSVGGHALVGSPWELHESEILSAALGAAVVLVVTTARGAIIAIWRWFRHAPTTQHSDESPVNEPEL